MSSGAGLASAIAVEAHGELGEDIAAIKARGYWEQVWLRLRRDRIAMFGGLFIVALLLIAFVGAPLAERQLGHGPNDINTSGGLDVNTQLPHGPWTRVTTEPYPGAPGYEALASCLASPEVRARTEGVIAWRPEACPAPPCST